MRLLAVQWHGTILAGRAVMLPEITCWTPITGVGHPACVVAGEQPLALARRSLSAALRAANPGPWLDRDAGIGAVVAHGRSEAVMMAGAAYGGSARCACFGVSCNAVGIAIANGAATLDAIGARTRAGTNCGSCRPEIRLQLRTARTTKAA